MNQYAILLINFIFYVVTYFTASANLIINIRDETYGNEYPLKMFTFCVDCPDPVYEGSLAYGLLSKYNIYNNHGIPANIKTLQRPTDTISTSIPLSVTAEAVYCVPNLANKARILNSHEINNRIALVNRGDNGMIEKVLKLQNDGAVGVIIIDDGQCNINTNNNNPNNHHHHNNNPSSDNLQSNSQSNKFAKCGFHVGGFSATDDIIVWKAVKIPVILITNETGQLLDNLMNIEISEIPRLGQQKITILKTTNIHNEF